MCIINSLNLDGIYLYVYLFSAHPNGNEALGSTPCNFSEDEGEESGSDGPVDSSRQQVANEELDDNSGNGGIVKQLEKDFSKDGHPIIMINNATQNTARLDQENNTVNEAVTDVTDAVRANNMNNNATKSSQGDGGVDGVDFGQNNNNLEVNVGNCQQQRTIDMVIMPDKWDKSLAKKRDEVEHRSGVDLSETDHSEEAKVVSNGSTVDGSGDASVSNDSEESVVSSQKDDLSQATEETSCNTGVLAEVVLRKCSVLWWDCARARFPTECTDVSPSSLIKVGSLELFTGITSSKGVCYEFH